ncbi:L,D-transpeptidase family protein [Stygiobacter electus]|uniref:L,D-transpeptidase n=1 Tax=Stygiobacter electus TaxID=3032292 RepID=A0AAE3P0W8_9BACT|nr:L,D-transpeptidase [Stygiobacter electus]MDF1612344.1 L,D-transpeptidase [Stygiobacter electus]
MLKNIVYIFGSVVIFFAGMVFYGMILNIKEITLKDAMIEKGVSQILEPQIIIDKKKFTLYLYNNKKLIKTYKASFGKNQSIVKTNKNDNVTPIGDYKICDKSSSTKYYKELKLDYPNINDASEALTRNYINKDEFDAIILAHQKNECTPKETSLGANISIHGIGEYDFIFRNLPFTFNWTNGSIAVSNESIDELYSVVKIGTPVKITYK